MLILCTYVLYKGIITPTKRKQKERKKKQEKEKEELIYGSRTQ